MILVAGLGNPGRRYARTRHNLGFWVADVLARRASTPFAKGRFEAETADWRLGGRRGLLVKPQTWMNLSGDAVGPLARWHKIPPRDVLVVCDDIDLPAGRLRARRAGGSGGHKGLASVLEALGTEEVPRLKIGVDRPEGPAEAWVLAPLSDEETEPLEAAAARAADAVETWATEGIEACMNRYNATAAEAGEEPAGDGS